MTLQCLGGVGYRKENGGEKEKKTEDKGKKMLVYKQGPQINKVKKKKRNHKARGKPETCGLQKHLHS